MRFRGGVARARIRVGTNVVKIAGAIASALVDLGLAIAPEISGTSSSTRRGAWLGLAVVALLLLGLLAAGDIGLVVLREALPSREMRP